MAKLGDICTLVNGYAFKPSDWSENGLPIIRIQNLNDTQAPFNYYEKDIDKKYYVENGDLLFAWSGTPGTSFGAFFWNRGKGILNQHIFNVHPVDTIDKAFFRYALNGNLDVIISKAHGGVGLQHITKKELEQIEIPILPLETQRQIAANLDKVTHTIDLCNAILEKLDMLVKSRFVEMFGEPVLNSKDWKMATIGDIVTEVKYGTSRPAVEGGKYAYLRMNNLTYDGHLDLTDLKRIDIPDNEIEKCIVRKGDVLFNRTNSVELVGKTCVFNEDEDMVIAGYIIRVRLKPVMLPLVLSCFMNTDALKAKLRDMAKGAVNQANINAQELQSIKVYLPPLDLQQQFAVFVEQTDKSKLAVKQLLEKAETLKKALMQEYFG
ncbi:type I restriction enzyme, S subunit [Ruminococcus flavefaciens]|uniref:Type I restriction enzyme, S subunit n=1 Tax=Ruminococcus flavefaciens TaxID=1265 RepID=A0A1H6LL37_RUMFL|nr:restriction endonuclease subunit S [Ruminococcus flavefaciens]SEH86824.1 type I restriction enzyme, S subunit [Ruminococcus flavefaciens]